MIELLEQKTKDRLSKIAHTHAQGVILYGTHRSNLSYATLYLQNLLLNDEHSVAMHVTPNEKNTITKKMIDEIISQITTTHTKGQRVIRIDQAELMHLAACNALLKSLEEPGLNTMFILSTHHIKKMPATVVSRLERVAIPQLSSQLLLKELSAIQGLNPKQLLQASRGSVSALNTLIDSPEAMTEFQELFLKAKQALGSDVYSKITTVKSMSKDKAQLEALLQLLIAMADAAVHATKHEPQKALSWIKKVDLLLDAKYKLRRNLSPKLVALHLMVQL